MKRETGPEKKIPFDKITAKERESLFEELLKRKPELLGSRKMESLIRFQISAVQVQPSPRVYVTADPYLSNVSNLAHPYTVNLGLDSGVYFLSAALKKDSRDRHYFDFSVPIFKIQRRKNFRCPLPQSVPATVKIRTIVNSPAPAGSFVLRDLSGRGASIFVPDLPLKDYPVGLEISLDLKIYDQSFSGMAATIRHLEKSSIPPWIGVEFRNLSLGDESELSAIVLDLQRTWLEIYASHE